MDCVPYLVQSISCDRSSGTMGSINLEKTMSSYDLRRPAVRTILMVMVLLAVGAVFTPQAMAEPITLVCVNAAARYSWTFQLDVEAAKANGFPATVTERMVTWFDTANKSNYGLDRVSGVLTISNGPTYNCRRGEKQF